MKSYIQVDSYIKELKEANIPRAEFIVKVAEACMDWPYVFGGRGELCTPSNRQRFNYKDHPTILTKCKVLNPSCPTNYCNGCKWFPNGQKVRFFDCRGFTYWVFKQAGIVINGAGATSQYNDNNNWAVKGPISEMPTNQVCCIFKYRDGKMQHTGISIGNGQYIDCSTNVKKGKIGKDWTHYAIPHGMEGQLADIVATPQNTDILRRGCKGSKVIELQTMLTQLGYDIGSCGIDGDFGKATMAAVKQFQTDHNLEADGVVGTNTWEALKDAAKTPQPPKESEPGNDAFFIVTIPHVKDTDMVKLVNEFPNATFVLE